MSELRAVPAGVILPPLGVRVRRGVLGPANALATRRELFGPIELYLSELGSDYIAGRIKQVVNSFKANEISLFASYSIVAAPPSEQSACAARHREALRREVAAQYKNAVVRAAAPHTKNAKRMRYRINSELGKEATPDRIDAWFADRPDAVEAAREIRALWNEVSR